MVFPQEDSVRAITLSAHNMTNFFISVKLSFEKNKKNAVTLILARLQAFDQYQCSGASDNSQPSPNLAVVLTSRQAVIHNYP